MFSSLFKCLGSLAAGTVGIGTTTPFIYTAFSQPFFLNQWRQTIDDTGLVISCSGHNATYKVVIAKVLGGGTKDLGLGVTLKLVEEKTSHYGYKTTVEKKEWLTKEGSEEWGFKKDSGNKAVIWFKKTEGAGWGRQEETAECKDLSSLGEWKWGDNTGGFKNIEASKITIEKSSCKNWFLSKTCNIKISSGNDLKESEIKPTITYYPL